MNRIPLDAAATFEIPGGRGCVILVPAWMGIQTSGSSYECRNSCRLVAGFSNIEATLHNRLFMKWFKAVLIAVPTFFGAAGLTVLPTVSITAMPYYTWKWFWKAALELLIRAISLYLDQVERNGHFIVKMNSGPIVTLFQGNPADAALSAEKGFGFTGNALTVAQHIVIQNSGSTGVALKAGEYPIDGEGNFQLEFIKVPNPEPSESFPIGDSGL